MATSWSHSGCRWSLHNRYSARFWPEPESHPTASSSTSPLRIGIDSGGEQANDAAPCRWVRSDRSYPEPLLRLSDARMLDTLADGERLRERAVGEGGFVVGGVRSGAEKQYYGS